MILIAFICQLLLKTMKCVNIDCQHPCYANYRHCRVHVYLAARRIHDWWDWIYRVDKIAEEAQKWFVAQELGNRWLLKTRKSIRNMVQREIYLRKRIENHYRPSLEQIFYFYEVPLELIPIIASFI